MLKITMMRTTSSQRDKMKGSNIRKRKRTRISTKVSKRTMKTKKELGTEVEVMAVVINVEGGAEEVRELKEGVFIIRKIKASRKLEATVKTIDSLCFGRHLAIK